jgi:micrococcal nuclease
MQRVIDVWESGTKGKVGLLGCGGLSILGLLLFSCITCGLLAGPSDSERTGEVVPTGIVAQATTISRPTVTKKPTNTPTNTPTAIVTPTNTPSPTDTPTPEPPPTPELTEAQVVEVVDGDTIKVEIDGEVYTVRYIGIDTPETVHPSEPVGWMGPEASEANRELVEGQTVSLEKDVSETDKYDRLLRYVYLADGTFVNAELVHLGYAQVSTYPPDVHYQNLFLEKQQEAREAERGLWGPTPTPLLVPTATPQPTSPPSTVTPLPTATPLPQPTAVPTEPPLPPPPTEPAAAPGDVRISYIYYDGQVADVESDEYAVIKNVGGSPVNLSGWRLNADDAGQDFWFPAFELQPGQECRVYTNENHPESCGFNFGNGRALWANSGECGHLYDANGTEVSTYCY